MYSTPSTNSRGPFGLPSLPDFRPTIPLHPLSPPTPSNVVGHVSVAPSNPLNTSADLPSPAPSNRQPPTVPPLPRQAAALASLPTAPPSRFLHSSAPTDKVTPAPNAVGSHSTSLAQDRNVSTVWIEWKLPRWQKVAASVNVVFMAFCFVMACVVLYYASVRTFDQPFEFSSTLTVDQIEVKESASFNTLRVSGDVVLEQTKLNSQRFVLEKSLLVRGNATFDALVNMDGGVYLPPAAQAVFDGRVVVASSTSFASSVSVNGPLLVNSTLDVYGPAIFREVVQFLGPLLIRNSLEVNGNLTCVGPSRLSGDLTVSGSTTVQGNVSIFGGSASFSGDLVIVGRMAVNASSLLIKRNLTIDGDVFVNDGSISVLSSNNTAIRLSSTSATFNVSSFSVSSSAVMLGNLSVFGSTVLHGSLVVNSSLIVAGGAILASDMSVSGTATIGSSCAVAANMSVGGEAKIGGDVVVGGSVAIAGPVVVQNDLQVRRQLSVQKNVTVVKDVYVMGNLFVARNASIRGFQEVFDQTVETPSFGRFVGFSSSGPVVVNSSLSVTSYASFGSNVSVSGSLAVLGPSIFSGSVAVASNLDVSGSLYLSNNNSIANFGGNLTVLGWTVLRKDAILYGSAFVQGAGSIGGSLSVASGLSVQGNVSIAGTLYVAGASTFGGDVLISAGAVVNQSLRVLGSVVAVSSDFVVGGSLNVSRTLTVAGFSTLRSSLTVIGPSSFNNTVLITNGSLLISNGMCYVSGVANFSSGLSVVGNISTTAAAVFVATLLEVGGNASLLGPARIAGALTVSGPASFTQFMNVLGGARFGGTVNVSGAVFLGSSLTVMGHSVFNYGLTIANDTFIRGSHVVAGNLSVSGDIVALNATRSAGPLFVGGAATFSRQVSVGGALNVSGTMSVGSSLEVGGFLSIAMSTAIGMDALVVRDTSVGGNVSVGGRLRVDGPVSVGGSLQVASLTVLSKAQFLSTVIIGGPLNVATLNVSDTVAVGGNLTVASFLTVNRDTFIRGQLVAQGDAFLSGALNVGGLTTFNSHLLVTGNLSVVGSTTLQNGLVVAGGRTSLNGRLVSSDTSLVINVSEVIMSSFDANGRFWFSTSSSSSGFDNDRKFFGLQVDSQGLPDRIVFKPRMIPGGSFVDSSGNFGIGPAVTTAQGKLHVQNDLVLGPSTLGSRFKLSLQDLLVPGDHFFLQHDDSSGTFSSTKMVSFQRATGNVGLSIGVPTAKLHVAGDMKVDQDLELATSGLLWHSYKDVQGIAVTRREDFFNSSSEHGDAVVFQKTDLFNPVPTGGIIFSNLRNDSETYSLVFRGNGSVGVNTLFPTHQLDVDGSLRARKHVLLNDFLQFDYKAGNRLLWKAYTTDVGGEFAVRSVESVPGYGFDALLFDKTHVVNTTNVPGMIAFTSTPANGVTTYHMVIRTDINRVGIKTLDPVADLDTPTAHVRDTMMHTSAIEFLQTPSTTSTLLFSSTDPVSAVPTGDGFRIRFLSSAFGVSARSLVFEKTDNTAVDPVGTIGFAMTGSDGVVRSSLVIRGSGFVGIGTASPSAALSVVGDIRSSANVIASAQYTISTALSSSTGIRASTVVANAQAHSTRSIMWSVLAAIWNPGTSSLATTAGTHSFEGNANFDLTSGVSLPTALVLQINFVAPYVAAPICDVNIRNYRGFVEISPVLSSVSLVVFDISGSAVQWTSLPLSVALQISCFGTA